MLHGSRSREDVIAAVGARFPRADVERLLTLLDTYGVEPYERERERVQVAIVNLSEGNEEKLRELLAVAKRDYRDVLFWSEYPEEARIDTPQKRRQIRELFKKLGLEVPGDVED